MTWKLIKTAPMDGTQILLANHTQVDAGHYWRNSNQKHPRNRWVWSGWPGGEPTHWKPLPKAPK
jgi:hypothetical protein